MTQAVTARVECASALSLPFADGTAHCCVTSPPYWGLRDYGNAHQLGLEPTPAEYVANMVRVFREVRRVLRDDGTLWLNLGDSYAAGCMTGRQGSNSSTGVNAGQGTATALPPRKPPVGLKPKDLVGIPWRVAFALQADGWYLRSDIVWHKPNPMPESVTDRPTKAHEYVFLLTKSARYFYDADAVREHALRAASGNVQRKIDVHGQRARRGTHMGSSVPWVNNGTGRNRRTVWTVNSKPYAGAHFATMPPALVEPCVKAGSPIGGVVLDPFTGSGTTGAVAVSLGRSFIGTEINAEYIALADQRIARALADSGRATPDNLPLGTVAQLGLNL